MICELCTNILPDGVDKCYCGAPKLFYAPTIKNFVLKAYKTRKYVRYLCINCMSRGLMYPNTNTVNQACPVCGQHLKYILPPTIPTRIVSIWNYDDNQ